MSDIEGTAAVKEYMTAGLKSDVAEGAEAVKEYMMVGLRTGIEGIENIKESIRVSNEESSPVVEEIDVTREKPRLKRSVP